MHFAVLLHGNGVFDGTEIQEAVLTLLAIAREGHTYQCIAPNIDQLHVINHTNGEVMSETRNVLIESARIARGDIRDLSTVSISEFDGLFMPGGFGTAKNFTTWALNGPNTEIIPSVQNLILGFIEAKKPIGAWCMSPTTIAMAIKGIHEHAVLSVGSTKEESPYDILSISQGIEATGAHSTEKTVREISTDEHLKIVCAPCYMMNANILEVANNINQGVLEVLRLTKAS